MDSHEIKQILQRDRFTKHYFRGVFASDQLPKSAVPRPSALVFNTDPASKPGRHWVAISITRREEAEYFDSYGQPPQLPRVKSFLRRNASRIHRNRRPLQGPLSAVCGQYCIFFLLQRCRGLSLNKIVSLFSSNKMDNDLLVNDFIRRHFPRVRTSVHDDQFLLTQLARALVGDRDG